MVSSLENAKEPPDDGRLLSPLARYARPYGLASWQVHYHTSIRLGDSPDFVHTQMRGSM